MMPQYTTQGLYEKGYRFGNIDLLAHGYDTQYREFDYVRQPIKQSEIDVWQEQGYTHKQYAGVMYDSTNPMPKWVLSLGKAFYGLDHDKCGYVIYAMNTGEIMPEHIDHYETYERVFDVKRNNIMRTLVFLDNWSPGHYFDIGGTTSMPWVAGDFAQWTANTPHSASNIGIKTRWTLQITGVDSWKAI